MISYKFGEVNKKKKKIMDTFFSKPICKKYIFPFHYVTIKKKKTIYVHVINLNLSSKLEEFSSEPI